MLRNCPELGQRFTQQATSRAFQVSKNGLRNTRNNPDLRNHRLDDLMRII